MYRAVQGHTICTVLCRGTRDVPYFAGAHEVYCTVQGHTRCTAGAHEVYCTVQGHTRCTVLCRGTRDVLYCAGAHEIYCTVQGHTRCTVLCRGTRGVADNSDTTLYIVWLPYKYKGEVINLMMHCEKAETCRC